MRPEMTFRSQLKKVLESRLKERIKAYIDKYVPNNQEKADSLADQIVESLFLVDAETRIQFEKQFLSSDSCKNLIKCLDITARQNKLSTQNCLILIILLHYANIETETFNNEIISFGDVNLQLNGHIGFESRINAAFRLMNSFSMHLLFNAVQFSSQNKDPHSIEPCLRYLIFSLFMCPHIPDVELLNIKKMFEDVCSGKISENLLKLSVLLLNKYHSSQNQNNNIAIPPSTLPGSDTVGNPIAHIDSSSPSPVQVQTLQPSNHMSPPVHIKIPVCAKLDGASSPRLQSAVTGIGLFSRSLQRDPIAANSAAPGPLTGSVTGSASLRMGGQLAICNFPVNADPATASLTMLADAAPQVFGYGVPALALVSTPPPSAGKRKRSNRK